MGMDGVRAVLVGKFLKPPLTSSRSPRNSSWILLLMSVSRLSGREQSPLHPSSQEYATRFIWAVTSIRPRKRTRTRNYSAVTKLWVLRHLGHS